MTPSKLEQLVEILKTIALSGPLKISGIVNEAKMNPNEAKCRLNFLVKQGLVESKTSNQRLVYAVTQRGIAVLRHFNQIPQEITAVEQLNNL